MLRQVATALALAAGAALPAFVSAAPSQSGPFGYAAGAGQFGPPMAERVAQADRRRPGEQRPVPELPPIDPGAVEPPSPFLKRESAPVPDRWRLIETLGLVKERWWDPYNQSTLKGDRPVYKDWFVNLSLISDTIYEPRSVPTPTSLPTDPRLDPFAGASQDVFATTLIPSLSIIKGDTAFKPPDYEIRVTPVFNYNQATVDAERALELDPRGGGTRVDKHFGLQEAFLDVHLRNVSDRYDFDSIRVGIQPMQTDFRGFLFQDQQLGVRLFGSRANNLYQYNLAYFRRLEKDTNSGLNAVDKKLRDDHVGIANLYVQDFPVFGFTTQATIVHNSNREGDRGNYYNENGFLERPAIFGVSRPRNYDVTYLGLNGDGHFGRFNLTYSFYRAIGSTNASQFASQTQNERADIKAWFAAAEPSIDFDWIRLRGSFLYASGDKDPYDDKETGFDAIFENPQFAGADTSYWMRQAVPLIGGGGVVLSGRNGLLTSLRSSKEEGQSNFNNPGLVLIGGGADLDLTPELRLSFNVNKLRFARHPTQIEFLRMQQITSTDIGTDISAAIIWRPTFIQNVVFRLSGAMLYGGEAFRQLFQTEDKRFYSVLGNVVLTF